jgi:hypothetical protein
MVCRGCALGKHSRGKQDISRSKRPNEECGKERQLTGESKEQSKPHPDSKVAGQPYSLCLKTVSRQKSLTLIWVSFLRPNSNSNTEVPVNNMH